MPSSWVPPEKAAVGPGGQQPPPPPAAVQVPKHVCTEFQGFADFVRMVREDWQANGRSVLFPGFQAVLVHRFGSWAMALPRIPRLLLVPIYGLAYVFVRNFYGIELPHRTKVGRRFCIGHQGGIVIHPFAVIGDDCLVRQNVTIGAASLARPEAPRLGNRVDVGAGAVIVGRVKIGDGARIGPNVVVMTNVPAGSAVVAAAPRIIRS